MKKILLLLLLLILLPYALAASNSTGCSSNLLNSSSISLIECNNADNSNRNCSNLIDFNLSSAAIGGEWITDDASEYDIPPFNPNANFTFSTTVDFKYLEIYHRQLSSANMPKNITITALIDGQWVTLLDEEAVNNDMETCRDDWLGASNQPVCARYEVNAIDVSKLNILVTDVTNSGDSDSNLIFTELMACETPTETCEYPLIFCDDFNYNTALAAKDDNIWNVVDLGGNVNLTFSPVGNVLDLNQSKFYSPRHQNPNFPVNYRINDVNTITSADTAPVFSTEFDVKSEAGNWTFEVDDRTYTRGVYEIKAVNTSATHQSLYYTLNNYSLVLICSDCLPINYWNFVKITSYFIDYDDSHYNSSFLTNSVSVYVRDATGNEYLTEDIPFFNNRSINQDLQIFEKEQGDRYYIDNYYVYIGTDKYTETIDIYYEDLYAPDNITFAMGEGEGSGDMATAIGTIWDDMGLKSTASRIMAGIFLMFMLAIAMFGVSLATHTHLKPTVLVIIELFLVILLTYIRLLPIWVPFLLIIIAAGVGALAVKFASSS